MKKALNKNIKNRFTTLRWTSLTLRLLCGRYAYMKFILLLLSFIYASLVHAEIEHKDMTLRLLETEFFLKKDTTGEYVKVENVEPGIHPSNIIPGSEEQSSAFYLKFIFEGPKNQMVNDTISISATNIDLDELVMEQKYTHFDFDSNGKAEKKFYVTGHNCTDINLKLMWENLGSLEFKLITRCKLSEA